MCKGRLDLCVCNREVAQQHRGSNTLVYVVAGFGDAKEERSPAALHPAYSMK